MNGSRKADDIHIQPKNDINWSARFAAGGTGFFGGVLTSVCTQYPFYLRTITQQTGQSYGAIHREVMDRARRSLLGSGQVVARYKLLKEYFKITYNGGVAAGFRLGYRQFSRSSIFSIVDESHFDISVKSVITATGMTLTSIWMDRTFNLKVAQNMTYREIFNYFRSLGFSGGIRQAYVGARYDFLKGVIDAHIVFGIENVKRFYFETQGISEEKELNIFQWTAVLLVATGVKVIGTNFLDTIKNNIQQYKGDPRGIRSVWQDCGMRMFYLGFTPRYISNLFIMASTLASLEVSRKLRS